MDRKRLERAIARQRAYCESRSPLYAAILAGLQADAGAPWLDELERAWRARRFAVDWEAAHLLLAGLHYWALKGEAPELAAVYPSCGGSPHHAGEAARAFLARAPQEFWRHLAAAHVQTNEVGRSVAWMIAAATAFGARGWPFHLVELGASAGLNLVGDWLAHECRFVRPDGAPAEPPAGWDRRPHAVRARIGLDVAPRSLARAEDRLWLKACVWADDLARLERLERAIAVFLSVEPPRLERCSFAEAPQWLERHCAPRAHEGLLVFNSIATVYLDDAAYTQLQRGMARVLARWGARALWAEYERPRAPGGGPLELRVHVAAGGELRTRVLATGEPRPTLLRFCEVPPWQLR